MLNTARVAAFVRLRDASFRDLDIAVGSSYSLLSSNILDFHWRVVAFADLKSACPRRSRVPGNLCDPQDTRPCGHYHAANSRYDQLVS